VLEKGKRTLPVLRIQKEVPWMIALYLEFLLNIDCFHSLHCPLAYVNVTTALLANDGNHRIIIMAIQVNTVTVRGEYREVCWRRRC
jgi:hypothetical protein